MFYAALDEETAVAETIAAGRSADQDLTLGVFRSTTELQVVDLVEPPKVISRFVEEPVTAFHRVMRICGAASELRETPDGDPPPES